MLLFSYHIALESLNPANPKAGGVINGADAFDN
jgi:hypothetical protein